MSEEEIKEDINEVFDIYIQNQQLKNKLREAVNINISLQNKLQQKENIIKEVKDLFYEKCRLKDSDGRYSFNEVDIDDFRNLLDKGE